MKRLMLVVGAVTITAAACSSSPSVVASVGDADITRADVENMVRNTDEGINDADFLRFLGVAIQWEAVEQAAAEEFSIDPTDEEVDARVNELVADYSPTATLDEYLEKANASEAGIRLYARQLIIQQAIEDELADDYTKPTLEDAAAELAEFPLDWTEVCSAHILLATLDEAEAVEARLEAGEDFGELATELSIDTQSGANAGDLGCVAPSGFVPEFAEAAMNAEIGTPTDPVESEYGYHIILVSSRTTPDEDTVLEYLDSTAKYGAVDAWFMASVEAANVVVPDSVGVWVTDPSPQVLPAT
ncbi:MAG: peptidylprolyl isomerase [Acidimicrobiia bacterium]|nr:peptidylprolyl isomerase [Acidimicrobiia bacterium]